MDQYSGLFQEYVISGTRYSVANIQAAPALFSNLERRQALHNLSFALRIEQAWPVARDLLLAMAPKMERAGFRDEWIPYLQQGIEQSRLLQDKEVEAELWFHLGNIWRLQGKLDTAHECLTCSCQYFGHLKLTHGRAKVLNQLAQVCRLQGHYIQAKDHLNSALRLLNKDDPERASSFFVRGLIALDEHKWKDAEDAFDTSCRIWQADNDNRKIAWSLQNLGRTLRAQGRYAEAIRLYDKSIKLLDANHDLLNKAIVHMNLGVLYSLQHQSYKALDFYILALPIFRKVQDDVHLAMVYINMAIEYRILGKWDEAESICLLSLDLTRKLGRTRSYLNAMDELGLIYIGMGQFECAIKVFQAAIEQLPDLDGSPGYERCSYLLTTHLQEAVELAKGTYAEAPLPLS